MSSRALLRVKRRRSEDPYEALLLSCQPKRARDSRQHLHQLGSPLHRSTATTTTIRSAGGDYEGAEYSDKAPPLPVVSKVFHLAGTVGAALTAAKDEAKLIEEIRVKGKPSKKPVVVPSRTSSASASAKRLKDSKSSVSSSRSSNNNVNDGDGDARTRAGFKAVLMKRKLGDGDDEEDNFAVDRTAQEDGLKVFDVVKAETRVEQDELDVEYRVSGNVRAPDVITCNDEPITRGDVGGNVDEFVYDLYYSTAEGVDGKLDLSFLDTYLDVQPYRNEDLDALENYGIVEPASMLERGFLGVEDEDSNDEDNWRNDYPDSDPEDTFDREEPDYDQCGFINDAVDDSLNYQSPAGGVVGDERLAEMLRIRMKLRKKDDDEEEGEEDEDDEEVNRWDHGNPKESRAYLDYKKRTLAQLKLRDDDNDDEEEGAESDKNGDDVEIVDEGVGARRFVAEKLNYSAYDDRLDKGSDSDSFDNYDDDD